MDPRPHITRGALLFKGAVMGYGGTPPETLGAILRIVKRVYVQAGLLRTGRRPPGIEWIEGERYELQEGAPPRLYFVRSRKGGALGGPLQVGARETGSIGETLTIHVWGAETAADANRYDAAMSMLMQLMDAFVAVASGYIEWGPVERMDGTDLDTFGEEYRVAITYTWEVPEDATVRRALDVLVGIDPTLVISPADPDRPLGATGQTYSQTVVSQPTRP